jgi:hypothetical protein
VKRICLDLARPYPYIATYIHTYIASRKTTLPFVVPPLCVNVGWTTTGRPYGPLPHTSSPRGAVPCTERTSRAYVYPRVRTGNPFVCHDGSCHSLTNQPEQSHHSMAWAGMHGRLYRDKGAMSCKSPCMSTFL